jgi:chromosome segregation ATPase
MLQLDGDDPWIEVGLGASQSAALMKGATVVVECEYIRPVEYLLQERAQMAAELRESSARLDGLSMTFRSEQADAAASLAGTEERVTNLAASLAGTEERVTNLAASLAGTEERVANLAASLAGTEQRIANLAASLAGTEERVAKAEVKQQAILQSKTWRLLKAGGGLILRVTGVFARNNDRH